MDHPPAQRAPTEERHALVFAGGHLATAPQPPPRSLVVAADSGYDHAMGLGVAVDLLVGDMDSISAAGLQHAEASGTRIQRHPEEKDQSDLELAIAAAVDEGALSIDIHGGEEGRIAHLLGVALELTDVRWQQARVRWHTQTGIVEVASPDHPVALEGKQGDAVSLVPAGPVFGVVTTGLQWQLTGELLPAGTSRGLSNQMLGPTATVTVGSGTLLVILEGDPG